MPGRRNNPFQPVVTDADDVDFVLAHGKRFFQGVRATLAEAWILEQSQRAGKLCAAAHFAASHRS
jgi:hypothetical protein